MQKTIPFFILAGLCVPTLAQEVGDHRTAGYTNQRSHLNSDAGFFQPPLRLVETVPLTDVTGARSLIAFEDLFLVGSGGGPIDYRLFDRSGVLRWQKTMPGEEDLDYIPAYANDIVVLGSPSTSTVRAVRVSDGSDLWSDSSIGSAQGRYPILTDDLALYHGANKLVAADADQGPAVTLWSVPVTTAQAPLALFGNRVYLLRGDGVLQCYSLRNGVLVWEQDTAFGSDGSDILATEKYVFLSNPAAGTIGAGRSLDGSGLWGALVPGLARPAMALAYGRLFVFFSENGSAKVRAYDPDSGVVLWEVSDNLPGGSPGAAQTETSEPRYAVAVDNLLYFYDTAGRIRALDAFSGVARWSLPTSKTVRGLSVVSGRLFVLFDDEIAIYEPFPRIYFAQIADGQGASTLFTINNLSGLEASGVIDFFAQDGSSLPLAVEGAAGALSSVELQIPPYQSVKIQTVGMSAEVTAGWAQATADQPINGTAVFQFNDGNTFVYEAGVANSVPTGVASVFASRFQLGANLFDTGIAIANVLSEATQVEVGWQPTDGTPLGPALVSLGPGEQTAEFLNELFDSIGGEVEGTLIIRSDVPIVITALRTQNGFQMSSYPVGSP